MAQQSQKTAQLPYHGVHPTESAQRSTSCHVLSTSLYGTRFLVFLFLSLKKAELLCQKGIHVPHIHMSLQANLFLACSEKALWKICDTTSRAHALSFILTRLQSCPVDLNSKASGS